jgi:leader peptidase (prepilin peptidase)/N-methyltransferase
MLSPLFNLFSTPYLFSFCIAVLGVLVGVLLNRVITRLPVIMENRWRAEANALALDDYDQKENNAPLDHSYAANEPRLSLCSPSSSCEHCNTKLSLLDKIPVLSFLILKGQCRTCGNPISKRYLLVELLTGLLSFAVAARFGVSVETLAGLIFTWSLITLFFIDYDTYLLPDSITLPLMWAGILMTFFYTMTSLEESVIGAVVGYMSLWTVYMAFKLLTGKEGMGFGDFKMLAAIGAFVGWALLPQVILLSALVGSIAGIFILRKQKEGKSLQIPFGPHLAVAGWIAFMFGECINNTYLTLAGLS